MKKIHSGLPTDTNPGEYFTSIAGKCHIRSIIDIEEIFYHYTFTELTKVLGRNLKVLLYKQYYQNCLSVGKSILTILEYVFECIIFCTLEFKPDG